MVLTACSACVLLQAAANELRPGSDCSGAQGSSSKLLQALVPAAAALAAMLLLLPHAFAAALQGPWAAAGADSRRCAA